MCIRDSLMHLPNYLQVATWRRKKRDVPAGKKQQ